MLKKNHIKTCLPRNYRTLEITIDKNKIVIGAMARPGNSYDNNLIRSNIGWLKNKGYTDIIALDPTPDIAAIAEEFELNYIQKPIEDFTAPSITSLEDIYKMIEKAIQDPIKKFIIHCREGMGRTGTVIAALKLKTLILDDPFCKFEEKTESISLVQNLEASCTPTVSKVIHFVREPIHSEQAVETKSQIDKLNEYQIYLIKLKSKKNN